MSDMYSPETRGGGRKMRASTVAIDGMVREEESKQDRTRAAGNRAETKKRIEEVRTLFFGKIIKYKGANLLIDNINENGVVSLKYAKGPSEGMKFNKTISVHASVFDGKITK